LQPPITIGTRGNAIERLRADNFDVLIIGGGINGAGIARDLTLRARVANSPIRIGLVEQNHFASGTSSRNSHLIHGGLRYLKMFDFHLVREALRERSVLLKIAPHLVEPLAFLLPMAGFGRELFYNAGLTLYDALSSGDNFPRHRRLPLDEVNQLEPGLAVPGMTGAAEYYDAEVKSARLVLENVFEATVNRGVLANYCGVARYHRDGDVWRVELQDKISGNSFETRAKLLIDATGPWAHDPAPRLVRGSHIIVPRLNASNRAIAYFEESGRIIFFIPWGELRDRTLIGTTDIDHTGSPDDVKISQEEIQYLSKILATVFPTATQQAPLATFSSLRPLLASHGSATKATREHHIFIDDHGIIRVTGGKFTTYRAMSEEAADLAAEQIAPELRDLHLTADTPLNELAAPETPEVLKQYGQLAPAVMKLMDEPAIAGLSQIDSARLRFAVRHEMAQHPADFLEVSTSLAHEGRSVVLTDQDMRSCSI
jgi:glycerol-3-phosphate dehydrogenase